MSFNNNVLLLLIHTILAHIAVGAIEKCTELANKILRFLPIFRLGLGNHRIVDSLRYEENTDLERFVEGILHYPNSRSPEVKGRNIGQFFPDLLTLLQVVSLAYQSFKAVCSS